MDLVRSCYRTTVHFGEGNDTAGEIEWYEVPAGTPCFPGWHSFTSLNWWDRLTNLNQQTGEDEDAPRQWRAGRMIPAYTAATICGPLEWFLEGVPSPPPLSPPRRTSDGVPDCCGGGPATSGKTLGGSAHFAVSPARGGKTLDGSATVRRRPVISPAGVLLNGTALVRPPAGPRGGVILDGSARAVSAYLARGGVSLDGQIRGGKTLAGVAIVAAPFGGEGGKAMGGSATVKVTYPVSNQYRQIKYGKGTVVIRTSGLSSGGKMLDGSAGVARTYPATATGHGGVLKDGSATVKVWPFDTVSTGGRGGARKDGVATVVYTPGGLFTICCPHINMLGTVVFKATATSGAWSGNEVHGTLIRSGSSLSWSGETAVPPGSVAISAGVDCNITVPGQWTVVANQTGVSCITSTSLPDCEMVSVNVALIIHGTGVFTAFNDLGEGPVIGDTFNWTITVNYP